MKAKIFIFSFLMVLVASCEDSTYKEYTGNDPVYMTYEEFRGAIVQEEVKPLQNPGKIYFKDNYIFIIEEYKGIHLFDNLNPASPEKISFLRIPGIIDMVISGNTLYADSFVDLVALDISDINDTKEIARIQDVFPYTLPPVNNDYPIGAIDQEKGLVSGWEVKKIRQRVHENDNIIYGWAKVELDGVFASDFISSGTRSTGVSSDGTGAGGSMARFGIKNNALYLLDNSKLNIFDITVKSSPVKITDMSLGWGIETMYLTENNMYLGTTTGMLIYDINDPWSPQRISSYNHFRSCDPVIVDDTLAYVTLRSGTNCGGNINSLDVINIKNLTSPKLVISYPMTNPHGLGKDNELLFVCDGAAGLKIYDATDPKAIQSNLKYSYPSIKAFDVIPLGEVLVMIGDSGLYQYDYSDPSHIQLLSEISVTQ